MKIGILTYHRSYNYGALLQAVALREILRQQGHDVYYIDYWPSYHRDMYAMFSMTQMLRAKRNCIVYLKRCVVGWKRKKERARLFNGFIQEYIEPYVSSLQEEYDVIVYGSDQIWRKQPWPIGYDKVYFGWHTIKTKKSIGYAASMERTPSGQKDIELLKKYLENVGQISVREDSAKVFIESLGYKNVRIDLDPSLLLQGDDWIKIFKIKIRPISERYAIFYEIGVNCFDIKKLRLMCKEMGLRLIILTSRTWLKNNDDIITDLGPAEMIQYFLFSDYIFTSSYHGVVFSIILKKQFLASYHPNSENRCKSLLNMLGISNRLIAPNSLIKSLDNSIDYNIVYKRMEKYRVSSLHYLSNIAV